MTAQIPEGLWNIVAWVIGLAIPFLFLALVFNSMAVIRRTGKRVQQSEEDEKSSFTETAKKGSRGFGSVAMLMGGFVLSLLLILPRRVEFFNLWINLANGLLRMTNLDFQFPLLSSL